MNPIARFWRFLWRKPNAETKPLTKTVRLEGLALMLDNSARDMYGYGYRTPPVTNHYDDLLIPDECGESRAVTDEEWAKMQTIADELMKRDADAYAEWMIKAFGYGYRPTLTKTPSGVEPLTEYDSDLGPVTK